jgi:hypothetical protein
MPSTLRFPAPRRQAIACALLAVAASALAADVLPDRQCAGGVCMANVDPKLAVAPCRDANIAIAWSQAGGAMSIQCWTDDAPTDQPIFVFDRRFPHGPVYDMTGIRAFVPESLPQIANTHHDENDAMLLACQPPKPPMMATGELLLTEKVPSNDDRHPYCYRILRVASTSSGIVIRADDGHPPKAVKDGADWNALAARMAALAAKADAQSRAHVTRARAPLRDTPDAKAAPHGFLVAGDAVIVLDQMSDKNLVKVLYITARGQAIERWIARSDIATR